jgi:SAM-dependent methyltransferase
MNEFLQIKRESGVHGARWGKMHGGYFSDHAVALPFVNTIVRAAREAKPHIIVDLGGGTGFISSMVAEQCQGCVVIDVEHSAKQLDVARHEHVVALDRSIDTLSRSDINPDDMALMLIMRSVIHYFGEHGIDPLLRHLRTIAKRGEFFIHQTASFEREREAECMNLLYRLMKTEKWYTTRADLSKRLNESGWMVHTVVSAPCLTLSSSDLKVRYSLSDAIIAEIRDKVTNNYPDMDNIFSVLPDGSFEARLHYFIYVCSGS